MIKFNRLLKIIIEYLPTLLTVLISTTFLVLIFPTFRVTISEFIDLNPDQLIATVSNMFVGLIAATIALYWTKKQHIMAEQKSRANLSVGSITTENVLSIKNSGSLPLIMKSAFYSCRDYERSEIKRERIINHYNLQRKYSTPLLLQDNITLSRDEVVTLILPKTGLIKGIEEYHLVIQTVTVNYSTGDNMYSKTFGIYRTTLPQSRFLYKIYLLKKYVNLQMVNYNMVQGGLEYHGGYITDYIYHNAMKVIYNSYQVPFFNSYDSKIFSTSLDSSNDTIKANYIIEAYNEYLQLNSVDTDPMPEDAWHIFRIDED